MTKTKTKSLLNSHSWITRINSSLRLGLPDQLLGLLATASLAANLLLTSLAQVQLVIFHTAAQVTFERIKTLALVSWTEPP